AGGERRPARVREGRQAVNGFEDFLESGIVAAKDRHDAACVRLRVAVTDCSVFARAGVGVGHIPAGAPPAQGSFTGRNSSLADAARFRVRVPHVFKGGTECAEMKVGLWPGSSQPLAPLPPHPHRPHKPLVKCMQVTLHLLTRRRWEITSDSVELAQRVYIQRAIWPIRCGCWQGRLADHTRGKTRRHMHARVFPDGGSAPGSGDRSALCRPGVAPHQGYRKPAAIRNAVPDVRERGGMSSHEERIATDAEAYFRNQARQAGWVNDPAGWAHDVLGVHLWSKQREICDSLIHNKRTVVASCHGTGKALGLDELVHTPDGPVPMGEIREGMSVLGADGKPVPVVATTGEHKAESYLVRLERGGVTEEIVASGDHLWPVIPLQILAEIQIKSDRAGVPVETGLWHHRAQLLTTKELSRLKGVAIVPGRVPQIAPRGRE